MIVLLSSITWSQVSTQPPEILRERKPQYKKTFTMKRLIFLRNKISTKGKADHCFNSILRDLDFPKLIRDSYPTAECMEKTKKLQALLISNSFLDRVQAKAQDRMETQLKKDEQGWEFRANFRKWKGDRKSGQLPDLIIPSENDLAQQQVDRANAKIVVLTNEIAEQGNLTKELATLKTKLATSEKENKKLTTKLKTTTKANAILRDKNEKLKEKLSEVTEEKDRAIQSVAQKTTSTSVAHRQTRMVLKFEDPKVEGVLMPPSKECWKRVLERRRKLNTAKYINPMGESLLDGMDKLRLSLRMAIRKRLSRRFRMHRAYSQGNRQEWIAEPKNPRFPKSMKIKVNVTYYNCCKHGLDEFPRGDTELDSEDTDVDLLDELERAGHSYDFKMYRTIYPVRQVWQPFLKSLKKKPKQQNAKITEMRYNWQQQIKCVSRASKIRMVQEAAADENRLIELLSVLGELPKNFVGRVTPDDVRIITATMSSDKAEPTTLSSGKDRKYPLLPDLGCRIMKYGKKQSRKKLSKKLRRLEKVKAQNKTKVWVVEEGEDYLLTHNHQTSDEDADDETSSSESESEFEMSGSDESSTWTLFPIIGTQGNSFNN